MDEAQRKNYRSLFRKGLNTTKVVNALKTSHEDDHEDDMRTPQKIESTGRLTFRDLERLGTAKGMNKQDTSPKAENAAVEVLVKNKLLRKKQEEIDIILRREQLQKQKSATAIQNLKDELQSTRTELQELITAQESMPTLQNFGSGGDNASQEAQLREQLTQLAKQCGKQKVNIMEQQSEINTLNGSLELLKSKFCSIKSSLLGLTSDLRDQIEITTIEISERFTMLSEELQEGFTEILTRVPPPPISSIDTFLLTKKIAMLAVEVDLSFKNLPGEISHCSDGINLPVISIDGDVWDDFIVEQYTNQFHESLTVLSTIPDDVILLRDSTTEIISTKDSLIDTLKSDLDESMHMASKITLEHSKEIMSVKNIFTDLAAILEMEDNVTGILPLKPSSVKEVNEQCCCNYETLRELESGLELMESNIQKLVDSNKLVSLLQSQVHNLQQEKLNFSETVKHLELQLLEAEKRSQNDLTDIVSEARRATIEAKDLQKESAQANWNILYAKKRVDDAEKIESEEKIPQFIKERLVYCYKCSTGPYSLPDTHCTKCNQKLYYPIIATIPLGIKQSQYWSNVVESWVDTRRSIRGKKGALQRRLSKLTAEFDKRIRLGESLPERKSIHDNKQQQSHSGIPPFIMLDKETKSTYVSTLTKSTPTLSTCIIGENIYPVSNGKQFFSKSPHTHQSVHPPLLKESRIENYKSPSEKPADVQKKSPVQFPADKIYKQPDKIIGVGFLSTIGNCNSGTTASVVTNSNNIKTFSHDLKNHESNDDPLFNVPTGCKNRPVSAGFVDRTTRPTPPPAAPHCNWPSETGIRASMKWVTCNPQDRYAEGYIRAAEFFDEDRLPEMVRELPPDKGLVVGDLTAVKKRRPVTAQVRSIPMRDCYATKPSQVIDVSKTNTTVAAFTPVSEKQHIVSSWTPGSTCPISNIKDFYISEVPLSNIPSAPPQNRPLSSRPISSRVKINKFAVPQSSPVIDCLAWGKESPLALEWSEYRALTQRKR